MKQEDIHYRTGGKITHASVEMLPGGRDIENIVIERIEYKEEEMVNGRKEKGCWLFHFAPNPYTQLPMLANVTNRKRLAKLYPECEGYLARLKNVAVRLTKERTKDPNGGGETWGLRISPIPATPTDAPAQPQKKVITADKVSVIVEWATKNGLTIDDIAKQYDFASDAVKQEIIDNLDMPE